MPEATLTHSANPAQRTEADEASDEELVVRAQRRPAEFTALFDRYWQAIFAYCRLRLPSWEDAEDVANEVFLAAFEALPRYRPRGNGFRSWLFGIAHNRVIGHRRRQGPRTTLPFADLLRAPDPAPPLDEQIAHADQWNRTLAMLALLPETERRVCELRLSGLTFGEIADVLKKRNAAVRKAESRAEERLRRLLLPPDHGRKGDGHGA
jgi:RNA polymerase sigma-70 factor (ECF subfamily)